MDNKEAAKVLRDYGEFLDDTTMETPFPKGFRLAIDAAIAALEASAEPAAWLYTMPISGERIACASRKMLPNEQPLYAATQHPRERALEQDATRGNFRAP